MGGNQRGAKAVLRITVVASMRNEGPFIVEWVTWYRMLGFTDVVVVTNNCTDRSPELLDVLQAARLVRHLRCDVPEGERITARKLAAAKPLRAVRKAAWVLVCDVDEFLVIHKGAGRIGDLVDLAAADPAYLGMSINWKVFGTGGVARFEDRPVHRQFVLAGSLEDGLSRFVKSIFRRPQWFQALGEHGPRGLDLALAGKQWGEPGMAWVNSAGEDVPQWTPDAPYLRSLPRAQSSHAVAQINHYMLRSVESFSLKQGTKSPVALSDRYGPAYFRAADKGDVPDASAFRYAEEYEALHRRVMRRPGVARLHHLCCADHLRLICEKAGQNPADDPRHAAHLALAAAAG